MKNSIVHITSTSLQTDTRCVIKCCLLLPLRNEGSFILLFLDRVGFVLVG